MPLWPQEQRGWSITAAELALTGGAVCWSFGSHLKSRMSQDNARGIWLGRGCLMLFTGIVACLATVLAVLPDWSMLLGWSFAGLGMGVSFPMLGVLTLRLAPPERQGTYSSAPQLSAALCTGAALAIGGLLFSLLHARLPIPAFASIFTLAPLIAALSWSSAKLTMPAARD